MVTAAADMLALLDRLEVGRAALLMREGGAAAAIAFGQRWPERMSRGVLLNPRSPLSAPVAGATLSDRLSRALLMQPAVIRPFAEMMRRQTRTDLLHGVLRHMYAGVAIDAAFVEQPAVMAHLVRDVQAISSRTVAGFIDEHRAYADGWRLPDALTGDWTMTWSAELFTDDDLAVWRALPGLRLAPLPGAGLLAQFTHPEQLVALLG